MAGVARVGDRTYGACSFAWRHHHTTYYCYWWEEGRIGRVMEGSVTTFANIKGIARVGDLCQHDYNPNAPYPHDDKGYISSGSSSVKVDGKPVARIGDPFTGTYSGSITEGSSDIHAGG